MKRNILLITFCFLTVLVFGQNKHLTILHTNDAHSQIYPLNTTLADTMKAGRGGFVRRVAMGTTILRTHVYHGPRTNSTSYQSN